MKKGLPLLLLASLLVISCSNNKSIVSSANKETSSTFSSYESSPSYKSSSKVVSSSSRQTSSVQVSSSNKTSSSEQAPKDVTPLEGCYFLDFKSILMSDDKGQQLEFKINIPYDYLAFNHDSKTFKKELAVATIPFAINAPMLDKITDVFDAFGFDDYMISEEYNQEETATTMKYFFGHKKIDNYDVINLTLSGYMYNKPWENNFDIGLTGNHAGFQAMAYKLLPSVISYLNKYKTATNLKVYMNGYSRSAAVGNLLSTILIDNKLVSEENLYTYLFETPCGIDTANTKEYKSIFNIINKADIITYVSPKEYGHIRVGQDVEIYKDNYQQILNEFDPRIVVPQYAVNNGCNDDAEFIKYLIDTLLAPVENVEEGKPSIDISTRANFVNNLQSDFGYVMSIIWEIPNEAIEALKAKVSGMSLTEMLGLLQEDALYNEIKPIFDEYHVNYDATKLRTLLNKVPVALQQKASLLAIALSEDVRNDVLRTVYFHTVETVVPLLLAL